MTDTDEGETKHEVKDEDVKKKLLDMSDEINEDIFAIKRKMEKKTTKDDENRIKKLEGKLKEIEASGGVPTVIGGKIYKDKYRIKRFGPDGYSSDYKSLEKYDKGIYVGNELLGMGDVPDKKSGWIRRARLEVEFQCCYNDEPANDKIVINIIIEEVFINKEDANNGGTLEDWIERRGMETIKRIGEEECGDWADVYEPCEDKSKINEILEKFEGIEISEVPQDVLDRLKRIEELIAEYKFDISGYEEQIANIIGIPIELRTDENRAVLIRLDEYVRDSNEAIRKFESEYNRIRKVWNIE